MTTCDDIRARLGPYVDGELDADDAADVREHVEACPRCAARLEAERAFLARIAAAGGETAPESLRSRVEAIVRSTRPAKEVPERGRRTPWGAIVPLAIAAGVAALLLVTTPWDDALDPLAIAIAEEFAADHAAHAIEWPSLHPLESDAPPPPAIPAAELTGTSRCRVGEEPYAHYTYAVNGSRVSVYLPIDGDAPTPADRAVDVGGLHVLAVDSVPGGSGAVLVSGDVDATTLAELWGRA